MNNVDEKKFEKEFIGEALDYSNPELWLTCPSETPLPVDVVYLYPSACMDLEAPVICPIDHPGMIQGAKDYFVQQASVFETVGNIFCPYWRQVNGALLGGMTFEAVDEAEWAEPRTDVYAALDYYFANLNQGRPYILAGDSQGSRLLGMVLGEYMNVHPEYYSNMICAYRIGDAMTKPYLAKYPHVKPAQGADDLGVCASWNTEGPENIGKPSLVVAPEAVAINPLNWRIDETPAGEELCLGCLFPHFPGSQMDVLEEKVSTVLNLERGVVIMTNPRLNKYSVTASQGEEGNFMEPLFGPASFHNCDYGFFYYNIRENAKLRVKTWFDKKKN